jgi:voltage-gated potassium channel
MGPSKLTVLIRRLYHALTDLHWGVLALAMLIHVGMSWLLMGWAGEGDLLRPASFLYWYATTAATVGYGDLAPKTDAGRLVTAFFVYPGGIAAFTSIIAKSFGGLSDRWRRRRIGLGDYRDMTHAIVLVGYDPERTPKMIDELVADADPGQQLILFTRKELNNDDERIRYVRARSLTAPADLTRAGVADAARVIVFTSSDNETLAAALAITAINQKGHIVCYFQDQENARLLTAHCPEVEVVLAPSVELVVKSVKDPGASHLLTQLVSHTDTGATLFSMNWPGREPTSFREAASRLIDNKAVLLSWCAAGGAQSDFCFDTGGTIAPGDRLFYVADHRVRPELLMKAGA